MDASTAYFLLMGLHFLCDFPLQGEFLAKGKVSFDQPYHGAHWFYCLAAHCWIHGFAVAIVLGWTAGMCELLAHLAIDYAKGRGYFGFEIDQALHLACKVVWLVIFFGSAKGLL